MSPGPEKEYKEKAAAEKSHSADAWMRVLDELKGKVNRTSYEAFLKPTRFDRSQGSTLFVRVPNAKFSHIGERYGDLISEAIDDLGLEFQEVQFIADDPQHVTDWLVSAVVTHNAPPTQEGTAVRPAQQQEPGSLKEYAEVLAHAVDTFGSKTNANAWLNRPNRLFNNRSPLQILTEDPAAVEEELVRIDHGMFL